jgi:hypothetical protein
MPLFLPTAFLLPPPCLPVFRLRLTACTAVTACVLLNTGRGTGGIGWFSVCFSSCDRRAFWLPSLLRVAQQRRGLTAGRSAVLRRCCWRNLTTSIAVAYSLFLLRHRPSFCCRRWHSGVVRLRMTTVQLSWTRFFGMLGCVAPARLSALEPTCRRCLHSTRCALLRLRHFSCASALRAAPPVHPRAAVPSSGEGAAGCCA